MKKIVLAVLLASIAGAAMAADVIDLKVSGKSLTDKVKFSGWIIDGDAFVVATPGVVTVTYVGYDDVESIVTKESKGKFSGKVALIGTSIDEFNLPCKKGCCTGIDISIDCGALLGTWKETSCFDTVKARGCASGYIEGLDEDDDPIDRIALFNVSGRTNKRGCSMSDSEIVAYIAKKLKLSDDQAEDLEDELF